MCQVLFLVLKIVHLTKQKKKNPPFVPQNLKSSLGKQQIRIISEDLIEKTFNREL